MTAISLTWLLEVPVPVLPTVEVEAPSAETYTAGEISTAVDKLVQGSIRRPYGALGERQTNTTFDDTMDAAAGVFILTSAAPFYVLLLGSRRLVDDLASALSTTQSLIAAVISTNRRVRPLESITSLGNARTALQALENATAARDSAFEDIADAPAFQRFDLHTNRFLTDAAVNIRVGTEIVQTPQEARSQLAGLVSSLTTAFEDVQRRVRLLTVGIDNYNSLNLPSLLAQGVISRARGVLQDRIDQLEALSPVARLESLRETTLDVLAAKAVVKGFGSLPRSGTFVVVEGAAAVFADEEHPATSAVVTSDFLDPYSIIAGADELTFLVDGGVTPITIGVQRSFVAKVEGTAAEPFVITGTTDTLTITLTGFSDLTVVFTVATHTVEALCATINAAVGSRPLIAEPYFNPEKFNGAVNTQNLSGLSLEFVNPTGGNWFNLGLRVGDKILVVDSSMAGSIFQITLLSINVATATRLSGSSAVVSGVTISVGPFNRFLRIRITDAGALAALDASRSLGIPSVTDGAAITLGFFPGTLVASRRTRADEIATSINSSPSASTSNQPRLSATATFVGSEPSNGRSEPTDPLKVVSSLYRAFGDVTTGGLNAVFAVTGAASAGVAVGNIVTLRTAAVSSQVGRFGTITAVTDSQVSATMTSTVSLATGLDLEFGLSLAPTRESIARVLDPSPVAGDYRTGDPLTNPTEMQLDRALPQFFTFGGQPLQFELSVGGLRVDFASTSIGVDTELSVSGTAAPRFVSSSPAVAIGSSTYVLLEQDPKVLGAGDRFEIYTGQYNAPEYSFEIIGFELGQLLLQLDGDVPTSFSSISFATDIDTPFARIRKVERNNYDAFKAQLDLWLALEVNQVQYFRDLNRFLNPLIVNENPTLSAVNTAQSHLQEMTQALAQLQVVLEGYQVDSVPRVDTLINSFLERGADRAVDTLLEGRFTDFFGYNSEEVSYIGDALERLRDVSRLDLPVRRKRRKEVADQELSLGQFEEPDFEFDQSDTQDIAEPDIPGQFLDVPGSNQ